MRESPLFAALFFIGCTTAAVESPPPPASTPPLITIALEDHPLVDAAVEEVIDEDSLPGVVVGIAQGSEIIYLRGFGYQDLEAQVPVDPSATLFRWASLSKGVAGVIAVQGIRSNTVSLEADVGTTVPGYTVPDRYLPQGCQAAACIETLPEAQRSITLKQLLTHTGAIQHYSNGLAYPVPPPSETDDPYTNTGIAWAIDYFKDAPLVGVPGGQYRYSTFGYNLAGVVLENQLGMSFGAAVDASISQPLGMSTMSADFQWVDLPRRAVGYVRDGNSISRDGDNDVSWKLPGGGFVSSGEDLTRYCAGLLGDDLIDTDTRDAVLWATGTPNEDYGLGFGVGTSGGERLISHTGAQQKTRTALMLLPDSDLCFTVMTNATWAAPGELVRDVANAFLSE